MGVVHACFDMVRADSKRGSCEAHRDWPLAHSTCFATADVCSVVGSSGPRNTLSSVRETRVEFSVRLRFFSMASRYRQAVSCSGSSPTSVRLCRLKVTATSTPARIAPASRTAEPLPFGGWATTATGRVSVGHALEHGNAASHLGVAVLVFHDKGPGDGIDYYGSDPEFLCHLDNIFVVINTEWGWGGGDEYILSVNSVSTEPTGVVGNEAHIADTER